MIIVILDGESGAQRSEENCPRPCSELLQVLGEELGGRGGGLIPSLGLGPQDNFLVSCLSNISLLSVRPSFHLSFLPSVLPSFFPPPRLASDMWCEACCHSARLWWIKKKKGLFCFDTMLARLKVCWESLGVLTCLRVEGLTRKIG